MNKSIVSTSVRMMRIRKYIFLILTLVWMIVIFMFSNSPGDESGKTSYAFGKLFCEIFVPGYEEMTLMEQEDLALLLDHPIRKLAHFTEYMILGALLAGIPTFKVNADYWKRGLIVWGIACLYAVSDEVHQLFVPGRDGAVKDVLLDSSGALVGVLLGLIVVRICVRTKNKAGEQI